MKTIEEAANAHALKTVCDLPACVSEMSGEEWQGWFKDEFLAGVEFAQRWIPIEEDLPEKDDCERCLWKNSGGIWFGTARQSDKPTHWRLIEVK